MFCTGNFNLRWFILIVEIYMMWKVWWRYQIKLESIIELLLEIMWNAFTQYVSIYRLEYFNIIPELSLLGAFYVGPVIPNQFSVILNCQL